MGNNITEKELLDKCRLFENANGEIIITSLRPAKDFNQEHRYVKRDIEKWVVLEMGDLKSRIYLDTYGREQSYYELNKYQFMLYAMHKIKKEFDSIKIQIVKEYMQMEQFIKDSNLTEEFKYYRNTGKELTKELQYYVVNYTRGYNNKGEFLKKIINSLYLNIFDKKAWQLYEERGAKQGKLRNSFSGEELRKIKKGEQLITSTIVYGFVNRKSGYEVLQEVLDIMKNVKIV